ncbi:uncharacterized protein LOC135492977 isoform X2 [Lineus longissimus]|uniref:uncharacterized protein LOC135492977 isoform X2 n=1 Tax=Lineus longissimus TaxID=88925 RepID=UPI002B4F83FB
MASLFEKPRSVHSGKTLRTKVVVQHRSDHMMQEQLNGVKNCQEALTKALHELEICKNEQNREFHVQQVKELKQKLDDLMLVLKIADKLNRELHYARNELQMALKYQDDNVYNARKRVVWLEDRMAKVTTHKVLHEPSTPLKDLSIADSESSASLGGSDSILGADDIENDERPGSSRADIRSNDAGYVADYNTSAVPVDEPQSLSEPDERAISNPRVKHHHPPTPETAPKKSSMKKSKHRKKDGCRGAALSSKGGLGDGDGPGRNDLEIGHDSRSIAITEQSLYPASSATHFTSDDEHSEEFPSEKGSEESDLVKSQQDENSSGRSSASSGGRGEDEEADEVKDEDDQRKRGVFMTETSFMTSAGTRKSRVTVRSPAVSEIADDELSYADDQEVDHGTDYWNSEHHRFEIGEHAQALCDLDPLSYHQVGLAVPGTFIHDVPEVDQELPWRPRSRGSDIKDIHRVALDKLSVRVQKIYEKIYDAAMLSVDPHFKDVEETGNFLQNFDLEKAVSVQSGIISTDKSETPPTPPRPKTQDSAQGNQKKAAYVRLVYYPKAIPTGQRLPNTRVNSEAVFPQLDPDLIKEAEKREVATRICDQGNLMKETKFTSSLFKSRKKGEVAKANKLRMQELLEKERMAQLTSAERRTNHRTRLKKTFKLAALTSKLNPESSSEASSACSTEGSTRGSSLSSWSSYSSEASQAQWGDLKPGSNPLDHSGLKWERVKEIIHHSLVAPRVDERRDAAKSLGLMKCGDAMVIYALRERLVHDEEQVVQYEAAKALMLLGQWDDDILKTVVRFLALGNTEVKHDLIRTMIDGKNVHYVNKKLTYFRELTSVLSHLCKNPDPSDCIAFDAAICLGKLCVADKFAKKRLKSALKDLDSDSHVRFKAMDVLVRQMNCTDWEVIQSILTHLKSSPVWKHRAGTAKLLVLLGPKHVCLENEVEKVYELLEKRLWDDANKDVRTEVAKAIMALGMFSRACERAEKRLDDANEDIRAQAVISVGTLGIRSQKIIKALLEMVELDSSEFVRLQVIRTFGVLGLYNDKRVMRSLKERERLEGVLASKSQEQK